MQIIGGVVYGYAIRNGQGVEVAKLLSTTISVTDASLSKLSFSMSVDGVGSYLYTYRIDSNRFYNNAGIELTLPINKDKTGKYYVDWFDDDGNSIREIIDKDNITNENGVDYFTIGYDKFIVNYDQSGKMKSLTPNNKPINDTYNFSLKLLIALLVSNNGIGVAIQDFEKLSIVASDYNGKIYENSD